jgi:hypothetical protein
MGTSQSLCRVAVAASTVARPSSWCDGMDTDVPGGQMTGWYWAWVGGALLSVAAVAAAETPVSPQQAAQVVAITDVSAQNGTVSAVLVNKSTRLVRDVHLLIRRAWVWENERHPGEDSPGTAEYYVGRPTAGLSAVWGSDRGRCQWWRRPLKR